MEPIKKFVVNPGTAIMDIVLQYIFMIQILQEGNIITTTILNYILLIHQETLLVSLHPKIIGLLGRSIDSLSQMFKIIYVLYYFYLDFCA